MKNIENSYIELAKDYEKLKRKCELQGKKNNELFHKNQELVSENTVLKEIVCEKFDIVPDVLYANIKLLRQQKKARDAGIRVHKFMEMSKNYGKGNK